LREFFILAGGLLAMIGGTYLLLGLAVSWLAPRIPPELESKMAAPFLRSLDKSPTDDSRLRYLQQLVDTLQARCAHLPYHFRVHIDASDAVNAIALPAGHIVVFKGLLDSVSSENELAFVLAHEMGHYAHRDHLRGLGRGLVLMALSAFFTGADSALGNLLSASLNLSEMRFSRSQESQADAFALQELNCLYGHVGGAADLFEKLPEMVGPESVTHYFSSHPVNRQRIADLKALARRHGYHEGPLKPFPP
jgi:Zn-dependent protease with chaperone function